MLDMLQVIEPESIDAIVCDPPYELGFMNKSWDSTGIAFKKETWQNCFEVLKPGGYLLALVVRELITELLVLLKMQALR